jgi:hypothetical protein
MGRKPPTDAELDQFEADALKAVEQLKSYRPGRSSFSDAKAALKVLGRYVSRKGGERARP